MSCIWVRDIYDYFPQPLPSKVRLPVQYLQRTLREALASTVTLSPFSAEHKYFPESFRLVSKLSVSPVARIFPSFIQVILGFGYPEAVQ